MGWLVGFSGPSIPSHLVIKQDGALFEINEECLHAQAGGIPETCCRGELESGAQFLISGIGISGGRILQTKDWITLLSQSRVDFDAMNGHFIVMRWNSDGVEIFTDSAGVRTLYGRECYGGLFFSSRLDWLAKLTGPLDIDLVKFGSQWILPNSINTSSVIKQVHRFGPSTVAVVNQGKLHNTSKPWSCPITHEDTTGVKFERTLREAMNLRGAFPWSLGLSGGLDSRVLCSIGENISAHNWGPSDHPDVQISSKLSDAHQIDRHYIQSDIPEVDQCIHLLRQRVGLTQVITPASASIERSGYGQLHAMGLGVIDGGFGEIARRQLFNQIVFRRLMCMDSLNVSLKFPTTAKAMIFNPEVHQAMILNAVEELNSVWRSLPQSMTVSDKADLLSIRSRLPNFFGFEQNYLDHVCISYMPYAQPSVLRALFQVPLRLRWNGRLLRRMIQKHAPNLSKYPLVKGTMMYPFRLGTVSSYAYTLLKKRFIPCYWDPRPQAYIGHMKEYILDTLRSDSVRHYEPYDQVKLRQIADRFAVGDMQYTAQLDWWLTFDLWRRVLSVNTLDSEVR
ncbi:MAG: hypothetical protein OXF08_10560 [Bacteroidetes bacterium]|nr:hypothetical protein [Bacteroidota bacterium]